MTALAAELTLTPEIDHIYLETRDSMFVALDVRATIPAPDSAVYDKKTKASLDVVVVIDNS